LTKFYPTGLFFAYQLGLLSLEPEVARPAIAVDAFHSILYGNISINRSDASSVELLYNCRLSYMKALGQSGGRYHEVLIEADRLLQDYPFDFEVLAYRADAANKLLLLDENHTTATNDTSDNNNSGSSSSTSANHIIISEIEANADMIAKVEGLYSYIESIGTLSETIS
jgi:hypothetical protein